MFINPSPSVHMVFCYQQNTLYIGTNLWLIYNTSIWSMRIQTTLMKPISDSLAWHPSSSVNLNHPRPIITRRNCLRLCVTLVLLLIGYITNFFAAVARRQPCSDQRRTCLVSWNRVHSLAMTPFAIPTASTKLFLFERILSLPIIRIDSGRSDCREITFSYNKRKVEFQKRQQKTAVLWNNNFCNYILFWFLSFRTLICMWIFSSAFYDSGSALKAGRWEVSSSIPVRAYRPSRLEFSVVFSETRVNINTG